ncbi:glycosyltransferase [Lentisphaerota bacterium WC36G]|nr:hypothetical protein LJT99_09350 [Lentisphaerae bacterium WC36]
MRSMLHCFWCGPSFPYHLRQFIKCWVKHLRRSKSEFEVVVWLTRDSFQAAVTYLQTAGIGNSLNEHSWSKPIPNCEALFFRASLGMNKFYIARPEALLSELPQHFYDMFRDFHANKRYTSASNLARLVIVNSCGGVYTDVDYLLPDEHKPFPKTINELLEPFKQRNRNGFYLSAVDLKQDYILIENQCVILDPTHLHGLDELLTKMAEYFDLFGKEIRMEMFNNLEYMANPKTIALNSSLFTSGSHARLLQAFRNRDYHAYATICGEIYRGEHLQVSYQALTIAVEFIMLHY